MNIKIISNLMEQELANGSCPFMGLNDDRDVKELGKQLEAPSLKFRLLRIFSDWKWVPGFISRWYLKEVKQIILSYQNTTRANIESQENFHPYFRPLLRHGCLNADLLRQIREVVALQKEVAQVKSELIAEGQDEEAIDEAIDTFYRCGASNPRENLREYLVESNLAPPEPREAHVFNWIEKNCASEMDQETRALLQQHKLFLTLYPADELSEKELSALSHIENVVEELAQGEYADHEISYILRQLLRMTAPHIRGSILQDYLELNAIKPRVNRDKFIKEGDRILAKHRNWSMRYGKRECERLAGEIDYLLGGDHVPFCLRLKNKTHLQKMIPNSLQLRELIYLDTSDRFVDLVNGTDSTYIQSYLTLSLFRGRGDGAPRNTVAQVEDDGSLKLFDIDEEESFMEENIEVKISNAHEGKVTTNISFGLPQAARPYSKALLKLFSWDGIKEKALAHFDRFKGLRNRREAFEERLNRVIEICRYESEQPISELTPRDLFFMIFGKDTYYEIMKKKGCTDLEFFGGYVYFNDADDDYNERENSKMKRLDVPLKNYDYKEKTTGIIAHILIKIRKNPDADFVDLIDINPEQFDKHGWELYQSQCCESGRRVQPFMLAYFLRGVPRRLVRCMLHLYKEHNLSLIENEGSLVLRLSKQM